MKPSNVYITISHACGEFYHVTARSESEGQEEAHAGVNMVLEQFAKGRLALIRVKPATEKDHEAMVHRGYVRFSFALKDGEWKYPEDTTGKWIYIGGERE